MYRADIDGITLFDPSQGILLESATVQQELNKVGSLDFTIRPNHQAYSHIDKMASTVTVREGNRIVFRGRVLSTEEGFHNELKVTCEGDLAYLLDTRLRPYDYQGSLTGYLSQLISKHNANVGEGRKFTLGNVTVTDGNDYIHYSSTEYPTTWDEINDKLIDTHGGYITVRYGTSVTYIDYLAGFDALSSQPVQFGLNLLDFTRKIEADDIATVVIPLGAKLKDDEGNETDERLTIEDVNDGKDYLADADAVAAYGWIETVQTWDDVTVASNLKTKGAEYLAQSILLGTELSISAVDLAGIQDGFDAFRLATYVKVTSAPHDLSANFLVSKISIDLTAPQNSKLSLGSVSKGLSDIIHSQVPTLDKVDSIVTDKVNDKTDSILGTVTEKVQTVIDQSAETIKTEVQQSIMTEIDETVAAIDGKAEQALAAASTAQTEADEAAQQAASAVGIANGKADVLIQSAEPSSDYRKPTTLWIDTTDGANTPKRWTGTAWEAVNDSVALEAASDAAEAQQAATEAQQAATELVEQMDTIQQTVTTTTQKVTSMEQDIDGWNLQWSEITTNVTELGDTVNATFSEQLKYIKFINGEIWLGRDPDPGQDDFKVVISNQRIRFLRNNAEVAYISESKLYITDAQILGNLEIGNFAWIPRSNGGMSLRYNG